MSSEHSPTSNPPLTLTTQFMATLGRWLRHFCYARLNTPAPYDQPGLRIVLSDAAVPGG